MHIYTASYMPTEGHRGATEALSSANPLLILTYYNDDSAT